MYQNKVNQSSFEQQYIKVKSGNIYDVKRRPRLDINGNPNFEIFPINLEFKPLKYFSKIRGRDGYKVQYLTYEDLERLDDELTNVQ